MNACGLKRIFQKLSPAKQVEPFHPFALTTPPKGSTPFGTLLERRGKTKGSTPFGAPPTGQKLFFRVVLFVQFNLVYPYGLVPLSAGGLIHQERVERI